MHLYIWGNDAVFGGSWTENGTSISSMNIEHHPDKLLFIEIEEQQKIGKIDFAGGGGGNKFLQRTTDGTPHQFVACQYIEIIVLWFCSSGFGIRPIGIFFFLHSFSIFWLHVKCVPMLIFDECIIHRNTANKTTRQRKTWRTKIVFFSVETTTSKPNGFAKFQYFPIAYALDIYVNFLFGMPTME